MNAAQDDPAITRTLKGQLVSVHLGSRGRFLVTTVGDRLAQQVYWRGYST